MSIGINGKHLLSSTIAETQVITAQEIDSVGTS